MTYYIDLIKFVDRPLYPVCGGKCKPKMQSHITEKKSSTKWHQMGKSSQACRKQAVQHNSERMQMEALNILEANEGERTQLEYNKEQVKLIE